jgi:hypothetical protein
MPAPTMMTLGPAAAAREPCCAMVSARSTAAASTRALLDVEELIYCPRSESPGLDSEFVYPRTFAHIYGVYM